MAIYRLTAQWSGFSGAPGYTNLHFILIGEATTALKNETMAKVRTFFAAWSSFIPNGVTINFPAQFERFTSDTGQLEGVDAVTPAAQVVGAASSAPYSAAAGACVTWNTNGVLNGRRIRGRTFMVPLAPTSAFQADGTLAVAGLTGMQNAANALVNDSTGMAFAVYHRPAPGGTDGLGSVITGASISDKTAVLRSRRD